MLTGETEFNQWYNTIPGINYEYAIDIELDGDTFGKFQYVNTNFFPLKPGEGWGFQGNPKNYHFTTEIHANFIYQGGEQLRFSGDDDVWIFINKKLVIDLGGVHGPQTGIVNLDDLGLTKGKKYSMDMFHAERHTTGSNFTLQTSTNPDSNTPGTNTGPATGPGSVNLTNNGQPANMTKSVKVFILMGQSNMVGAGKVEPNGINGTLANATKSKGLYKHLLNADGIWTVRKDVRNVFVMRSGISPWSVKKNDWLTAANTNTIGPELGFGYIMGHFFDEPVLILKSCIGNRSLGWDLLPPGSAKYQYDGYTYAGFGDSPMKWLTGTTPTPISWTAGIQYVGDTGAAKDVLAALGTYYPGATKYEIAGFVFWQGDKDRYDAGLANQYEKNLVKFIKALRQDFNAPNAPFVCATLGQTVKGATGNEGLILNAQLAVDGETGKYPEFKGNVATVYSNPLSKGGTSSGHYGGNAETYENVGEALGWAMAKLLGFELKQ